MYGRMLKSFSSPVDRVRRMYRCRFLFYRAREGMGINSMVTLTYWLWGLLRDDYYMSGTWITIRGKRRNTCV
ncbi:hypothetical protein EYC84_007700 [Monilinia fructicola]|uniref:Uncharacterized protein n=1 Tax=Monilinia fructicola TaxID=38448 RepID=A0A5M9JL41_MONFR|nr:hypothetical protein EYC84_007700 [Monilinia fructicola]